MSARHLSDSANWATPPGCRGQAPSPGGGKKHEPPPQRSLSPPLHPSAQPHAAVEGAPRTSWVDDGRVDGGEGGGKGGGRHGKGTSAEWEHMKRTERGKESTKGLWGGYKRTTGPRKTRARHRGDGGKTRRAMGKITHQLGQEGGHKGSGCHPPPRPRTGTVGCVRGGRGRREHGRRGGGLRRCRQQRWLCACKRRGLSYKLCADTPSRVESRQ